MRCSNFGRNIGGEAASVSRRETLVEERSLSLFFSPFKFLPPLLARDGGFDAKIFPELAQVIGVRLHLHHGPLSVLNDTKEIILSGGSRPSALRASVWSKNKGGGGRPGQAPLLDPPLILSAY